MARQTTEKEDGGHSGIDGGTASGGGFALKRRSALKSGALGLAALTGFASNAAAHHDPNHGGGNGGDGVGSGANQFRFDGEPFVHFSASTGGEGESTSEIRTLLEVDEVKQSNSWQDSLVFQPSIESSLVTDIGLTGDYDRSRAAAGVLGWVEVRESGTGDDAWQMVTVDDDLVDPPEATEVDEEGEFDAGSGRAAELARGVVTFNTRDFVGEWDLTEITEAIEELDEDDDILDTDWDELYLDLYVKTRSANTFNFVKTNLPGTHDVRLRAALHVFVDDDTDEDVNAIAEVGSRTMLVDPKKIKAGLNSD